MDTNNNPKHFSCELCHYYTSNKKDYNKHLLTGKHKKLLNTNETHQNPTNYKQYTCTCGKTYKHMSSLCKHKNNCNYKESENSVVSSQIHSEVAITDKELIIMLIKQVTELLELLKNEVIDK